MKWKLYNRLHPSQVRSKIRQKEMLQKRLLKQKVSSCRCMDQHLLKD